MTLLAMNYLASLFTPRDAEKKERFGGERKNYQNNSFTRTIFIYILFKNKREKKNYSKLKITYM